MPTIQESIEMYNNISRRFNDINFPIDTYNRIINSFNFYDYAEIMNPIISRLESCHNQIQTISENMDLILGPLINEIERINARQSEIQLSKICELCNTILDIIPPYYELEHLNNPLIVNFPTSFENQVECEFNDDAFIESVRKNIDLTCDILSNQEQSQETSGIASTLQEIKLKLKSIKPELILQTLALIVTILMCISGQVSDAKSQQSTEQLIDAVNNVAHAIESLSIENAGDTVQLDMNDN